MFVPQFLVVCLVLPTATAFAHPSSCTDNSGMASRQSVQLQERTSRSSGRSSDEIVKKKKCRICPEPEENADVDQREAAFAMLGTLWAALSPIPSSHAVYDGQEDAKIELPNIVDSMN